MYLGKALKSLQVIPLSHKLDQPELSLPSLSQTHALPIPAHQPVASKASSQPLPVAPSPQALSSSKSFQTSIQKLKASLNL